jgi:hypothetical protein
MAAALKIRVLAPKNGLQNRAIGAYSRRKSGELIDIMSLNSNGESQTRSLSGAGVSIFEVLYASRVRLGVALIALLSVYSTARALESALLSIRWFAGDNIIKYESRFAQLEKYLPPDGIVGYSDDFTSQPGKECNAFVLAQYSLAPSVLETVCSQCGYVAKTKQASAYWSGLLLLNLHNPKTDPYLLNLIPPKYFETQSNRMTLTPSQLFPTNQIWLVRDFGDGVRLYEFEDK